MRIINGLIYSPECEFRSGTLEINGDVISGVSDFLPENNFDDEVINAQDLFIIPGLTDIHFHGCMGFDLCDGNINALKNIAEYQARQGVLNICPATMTLDAEKILKILANAKDFRNLKLKNCAELVGINLEGPFISPEKCGAQDPKFAIKPDINLFEKFYDASGSLIKICCVAPELDGSINFIKYIRENFKDVRVSLAHTCTDYDTALNAFNAGINHITHLYNAMNGINHRQPGPILAAVDFNDENNFANGGASLQEVNYDDKIFAQSAASENNFNIANNFARDELANFNFNHETARDVIAKNLNNKIKAELICDGVHVHEAAIKNAFRLFKAENIMIISDSLRATGMPDGEYELGGQIFIKRGNKTGLKDSPDVLAGSVTNLMDCLKILVKNKIISLEQAVKCAAVNPAKAINIYDKIGSIEPGKVANLVLLDKNLEIKKIFMRGKELI